MDFLSDIKTARETVFKFIWFFKVGDNIVYNLRILSLLYTKKEEDSGHQYLYNKPIIIFIVSVIEAIFFDLMFRLSQSTNEFPKHIPISTREEIKKHIEKEKVAQKRPDGKPYRRIKNYQMGILVNFLKKYELLGDGKCKIYEDLEVATFLRNRIHIFNYKNNFEADEHRVFSEERLQDVEKVLEDIIKIMSSLYKRPYNKKG